MRPDFWEYLYSTVQPDWQFGWVQNSRLEIIFPQNFESIVHWLLASCIDVHKSEANYNPDPFFTYDCLLFLEAWRIFSLSSVVQNFTTMYLGMVLSSIRVGPSDLETGLWVPINCFVNDFLPSTFSVRSLELPLFRNWISWTLLKSHIVFSYFHLSLSLLFGRLPHNFIL